MVAGAALLGRAAGKAAGLFAERGPEDPEALVQVRRLFMFGRIDALVLALILVDMVLKPGS
jgi:hypothetical protein